MTRNPWSTVALALALALAPRALGEDTAVGHPAEAKGTGPAHENAGTAGREHANELPRPGEPNTPPTGTGSAVGAPGAPETPGTATATEAGIPKAASQANAGASGPAQQLVGTIGSVDAANRMVELSSSSVRLRLQPDAQIVRNGHRASVQDLRKGDRVRATYTGARASPDVRALEATSNPR